MRPIHVSIMAVLAVTIAVVAIAALPTTATAQISASAFTYQGELKDAGVGVNTTTAHFIFRLWDSETGGHPVGTDYDIRPVEVVEGVFTVLVDFGETAFTGEVRWLEIGVDLTGGSNYTWMTPRQPLTSTPMALHALHGGDNPWTITGSDITYTTGNVGVGTTTPTSKLHVEGTSPEPITKSVSIQHGDDAGTAIYGEVQGTRGYGVRGDASNTEGQAIGVYGEAHTDYAIGVKGRNYASSGAAYGVFGVTASPEGKAVAGYSQATEGPGVGVYGEAGSSYGYAGYFMGRGYFDGWVGIGEPIPSCPLDVDGMVRMDYFQLDSSPQDGYVLTSDPTGRGSWQPASSGSGFWEPGEGWIYYDDGDVGIGTNNPTAPLEVRGTGEGAVIKSISYDDGHSSGKAIYAQLDAPSGKAIHGKATATEGSIIGVYGEAHSSSGHGVYGVNLSQPGGGSGVRGQVSGEQSSAVSGVHTGTSGYGKAVFGRSDSPNGYGGYFMGRSYFQGNVGFGVTNPSEKLDIDGTVKMNGFKLGTAPQDGYVLTSDASGMGSWQPAASAGLWQLGDGDEIYYNDGYVGIGTSNPSQKLEVYGTFKTLGIQIPTNAQTGYVLTTDGVGTGTWQPAPEGHWVSQYGSSIHYSDGNVGIGVANPQAELDVNGEIECNTFWTNAIDANTLKLRNSPQAGYVLTSDASGNGTWQPSAGGLSLPYEGSTSSTGAAFKVTNTGINQDSHAIYGKIQNTSGSTNAAAGYFDARNAHGSGIIAKSDHTAAIFADNSGAGNAVFATNGGSAAAGYFSASGDYGHGLEASASGEYANGLYATASGGGAAIVAEPTGSSTIGIIARGSSSAGKFYGNVAIYEFGTTTKVLELGKGLDYAEGFDITEAGDANVPAGTVLVIDAQNPGHLTRCSRAYDRRVAGIVAGANGLGSGVRLGGGEFDRDVALAGRVYCNVIALDDDIEPGDLLTTSNVPGYAMKVRDHSRAHGAVLGKAMESLKKDEKGQILVLVTLH